MNRKRKITTIISVAALVLTLGVTTAFAAANANAGRGILTDEQRTQIADFAEQKLEQGLADGIITQEQIDECINALANGEMPSFGRFGGHDSFGSMTEEQRAAMEEMWSRRSELTDEQIADMPFGRFNHGSFGSITDEQRAALEEMLPKRGELSDEQRARMPFGQFERGGMDEMKSIFDALTDEQRAEIESIIGQGAFDSQLIEKLLEYGIIDSETAESMKGILETFAGFLPTDGSMPMFGRGMRGFGN